MVASPGLLEHAPHTHIATVRAKPADEGAILRAVTDALPNVSGIRVADVLGAVADLVGKIAAALAATGSVTLASGALVLAGAVAAGQRRRMAEAIDPQDPRRDPAPDPRRLAGRIRRHRPGRRASSPPPSAPPPSWAVVRFVMHADWVFLPGALATHLGRLHRAHAALRLRRHRLRPPRPPRCPSSATTDRATPRESRFPLIAR